MFVSRVERLVEMYATFLKFLNGIGNTVSEYPAFFENRFKGLPLGFPHMFRALHPVKREMGMSSKGRVNVTCSLQLALVGGIFAATVIVVNRGMSLCYAVSLSAVLIAVTTRLPPAELLVLVGQTLADPMTLDLLMAVVLIRWLGELMNKSGSLSRSSNLLQQIVGDLRVVAAVVPMLIGVLMVPGGAILSAPSVERLTCDMDFPPSKQAAVNLIFRHIGQIFFPMSASLLMLTSIVGVNLIRQALYLLPIGVSVGLFAFHFYFSTEKGEFESVANGAERLSLFRKLIVELSPILMILVLFILTQQIAWSLVFGAIWLLYLHRFSMREALSSFQVKASLESMLLIIGTLVIRTVLQNEVITGAFAVSVLHASLIPLIISLLPWLVAFFTGSVPAAISLVTPLLLPFVSNSANAYIFCSSVFMAAFGGYLVSPIHLCLSLTAEYYNVSLGEVYQDILVPAGAFLASAVISSFLMKIL